MNPKDVALRDARARAGRIREGIHSYLTTLAVIAEAWQAQDWRPLGYADWADYVDAEFGAERLRLPAEHRRKAVEELRLAGMSQRAIASAVGVNRETVANDLQEAQVAGFQPPDEITGADGKVYPARAERATAQVEGPEPSPLVTAMKTAIQDVADAIETHLPPDDPWRAWRSGYLGDIQAAYRVISRQTVDEVVERADEDCVDELYRLVGEIGRHADEVRRARLARYGDNVVPLRAVQ